MDNIYNRSGKGQQTGAAAGGDRDSKSSTDLHFSVRRYRTTISAATSTSSTTNKLVENNKHSLFELILKKKSALLSAFEGIDSLNEGRITRSDWAEVMARVTVIKILWLSILPTIVASDCIDGNYIWYRKFLYHYSLENRRSAVAGKSPSPFFFVLCCCVSYLMVVLPVALYPLSPLTL
jgi:hypothetical protein